MSNQPGILVIDRDRVAATAIEQALKQQGHKAITAASIESADELLQSLRAQRSGTVGVVLIDQDAAGHGLAGLGDLVQDWPTLVPIVISAFRKVESAISAMRLGAADYLLKPIIEAELIEATRRAMQRHLIAFENELKQEDVGRPIEQLNRRADDKARAAWEPMPLSEAMKAPERAILLSALEANGWNRGKTAKQLDINRTTLYKKIRMHRLDEPG